MQSTELSLELLTRSVLEIEDRMSLSEPGHLQQRIEVLDRLEAFLFPLSAPPLVLSRTEAEICERARAIQANLEAATLAVYASIRRDIRQGHGRNSLLRWLPHLGKATTSLGLDHEGYDYLDEVITGVLQFEEPEPPTLQPTAEMVYYQPTPARHIFDLLERTALTEEDVLVDVGSGLGHVSMLTAIWTSARSVGVELEPAYVTCARRAAESLNLKRVTFIQKDARAADFGTGTVFYLYTPFTGTTLRTTLDVLRSEANTHTIRICTFGPCTGIVAAQNWLDTVGQARPDRISIFRSAPAMHPIRPDVDRTSARKEAGR